MALHLMQSLGEEGYLKPFVRYSFGDGGATSTQHNVAWGLGIEQLFGLPQDLVAVSAAWSRPDQGSLKDQYVIEAFYRAPLTPLLTVTPDVQMIVNPSRKSERDVIWVFSLRLRAVF